MKRPRHGPGGWGRHARRHHSGSRRFFWRVYRHGILVLLVVGGAMGAAGALWGRQPAWREFPERVAAHLAHGYGPLTAQPEKLAEEARRARVQLGIDLSLYDLDGRLLTSNVDPPLAPLAREEARALGAPVTLRWGQVAAPLRRDGVVVGYAIGSLPHGTDAAGRGVLIALAVLGALALASYPLARQVTAPLERLTVAVKAFGQGDLSVRTGLCRNDEVGELSKAFDEMAGRVELLVRSERELLANVSHEFRTPLSRIRVALELADEGDHEKARRYLGEIGADLAELDRLVGDVLTAARLELAAGKGESTGAPPLRRERVAARELVDRAAERFRAAHPERLLEVTVEGELPLLDADPALLRRVIDNLLDNARKYSDGAISLVAGGADGGVFVAVKDGGIGIDEPDLPRLFTPFFRTDRSRARGTGGVGLGLTLARRIVEAHGGTIGVESTPGAGTTVRFRVPAAA